MAVTGRRVLLAAHQRLAVGGIGTVADGLATYVPAALAGDDAIGVEVPVPGRGGVRRLGARGAAARLWYEQVVLARRAREVDLLHLCDLRPVVLSSTPFVITVHDLDFLDRPHAYPAAARAYKAAMLRAAIRKGPAAVISHSDYVRGRLLERFPAIEGRRVRVIRPGVPPAAADWTGGADPPFFLTVSTISPRKNHAGLLEAFRLARARGLEAEWAVAGTPGPGSGAIVRALRCEPGVRVLGPVDGGRLAGLYRDALFLAAPSTAEGFGLPPLEAMAHGTPVLVADGGSLPEVVGDAGRILPAGDTGAWAEALTWLAEDAGARERLSASGRRRATEFSWERTAAAVIALYQELLATGPS